MKDIEIFHIIDSLADGGAENVLCKLVSGTGENFDHTVCYFLDNNSLVTDLREAGADIIRVDHSHEYNPITVLQMARHLRRSEPDIVHTHLKYSSVLGRVSAIIAGSGPVITTYHNVPEVSESNILDKVERILSRVDTMSVAVSKGVQKKHQMRNCRDNWKTIYNGIDVENFNNLVADSNFSNDELSENVNDHDLTLLNVGRYVEQKRQILLVKMMEYLLDNIDSVHLYLVGWGKKETELKQKVQARGLQDYITVTGRVPTVHEYYKTSDIYVCSSRFEGFGMVLLEAMAARLPVVSTNVTGVREVVDNGTTGTLVPDDPERFAEAVYEIWSRDDTEEIGQQGYKRAIEKFSVESMISSYEELYRDVL